jgi:hypothetical protein
MKHGSTSPTLCTTPVTVTTPLYTSIGYEETGRGSEAGYDRVFMRKQLRH